MSKWRVLLLILLLNGGVQVRAEDVVRPITEPSPSPSPKPTPMVQPKVMKPPPTRSAMLTRMAPPRWEVGLTFQAYRPNGELTPRGGSKFSLDQMSTAAMIGVAVRWWGLIPMLPKSHMGLTLNTAVAHNRGVPSTAVLAELETYSFITTVGLASEFLLPESRSLYGGGSAGIGLLVMHLGSSPSFASENFEIPIFEAGVFLRWQVIQQIYALFQFNFRNRILGVSHLNVQQGNFLLGVSYIL